MKMQLSIFRAEAAALSAILILASGCSTSYDMAVAARSSVLAGDAAYATRCAETMSRTPADANLGKFELARLRQLSGDFAGSSAILGPQLDDFFVDESEGPILKMDKIGGNMLAGTLGDDRTIPYDVPAYELIFALQYQALNSYHLGKRDNARVYLRRATAAQEQLKEKAEQDAAADGGDAADDGDQAANIATASGQIRQDLDPVANAVRSAYENALAWYLMGTLFALEREIGNDAISYGQAVALCPELRQFVSPQPGPGEDVIVVFEESLVDIPEPVKIPLPLVGGTISSVDFPTYRKSAYVPSRIGVFARGANTTALVRAVNVQALAYRSLRDRLAGIVTRNITRAALKIAAQQTVNHISTGSTWGNAALRVGVFAFNAVSTVAAKADTRSWQTLPQCVQLCRIRLPQGARSLAVINQANGRTLDVALPAGGKGPWLVWISDIHAYSTVSVVPLASGAATWRRDGSLLGTKY